MFTNRKRTMVIILSILIILNIILMISFVGHLYIINGTMTQKNNNIMVKFDSGEINKENFQDSVLRASEVIMKHGIMDIGFADVSSFEYTYFIPSEDYYIDVIAIPSNANYLGYRYEITSKKIFYQTVQNNNWSINNSCDTLSMNQIYAVLSSMQKNLYVSLFGNCKTSYSIVYKGMVTPQYMITNSANNNLQIYNVENRELVEVSSAQDSLDHEFASFQIIVDDTIRYILIDRIELMQNNY